jgi:hypothetical protein
MKFNKWTLGLAALGVVSLASAARADEKVSSLQTALSNTTISGSVSASMNWDISPGGSGITQSPGNYIPFQANKQDGFNLDVVRLTIAKPEDESPWASGYQVDLMMGPDAVGYNTSAPSTLGNSPSASEFGIKQAYVTLRTPVGNGIDWKFGVFDTIIGYEVTDAGSDPNYTRSWGYAIEPTEHTGVLATYKINDQFTVSAGVANTLISGINNRDTELPGGINSYWHKTWMGSVTYTAPTSWGWAAGSSLYAGVVYGFGGNSSVTAYQDGNQVNYYAGATINTPWKQFTGGVAFDYAQNISSFDDVTFANAGTGGNGDAMAIGLYGTYKATDKLSFNGRGEYVYFQENIYDNYLHSGDGFEVTATVEYDLWANVMTRLEARWDRITSAQQILQHDDAVGLYANIIYKF